MATSDKPTKKKPFFWQAYYFKRRDFRSDSELLRSLQEARIEKNKKNKNIQTQVELDFLFFHYLSLSLSARVCICRNARGTFTNPRSRIRDPRIIKSACIIYANPFTETEKRGGLACHSRDARTNPRETPSGLDGNSYNYVERERKRIVVCRVYCTRKEKKKEKKKGKREREREKRMEEPIWGLILIFNQ